MNYSSIGVTLFFPLFPAISDCVRVCVLQSMLCTIQHFDTKSFLKDKLEHTETNVADSLL